MVFYFVSAIKQFSLKTVDAGLTSLAGGYQWSSFQFYIGIAPTPQWLKTKFVLNMIELHQRRKSYRFFVEKGIDD